MEIKRANPYLNEFIQMMDQIYFDAGGSVAVAWDRAGKSSQLFMENEIRHCLADPRYYLENYHTIRTEQDGLKTLSPFWDSQELFYEEVMGIYRDQGKVMAQILKARQLGISTICEGLVFWKTLTTPVCNALIVATDTMKADHQFEMSRLAYDCLPWWFRPEVRYDQKGRILTFDRRDEMVRKMSPGLRSNIYVEAANKTTGVARGMTIRAAHLCLSDKNFILDCAGNAVSIADARVGWWIQSDRGMVPITAVSAKPAWSIYDGAENGYRITPWCNSAFPIEGTGNHCVLCCHPYRGYQGERKVRDFEMKELRDISLEDSLVVPVLPITVAQPFSLRLGFHEETVGGTNGHGGTVSKWAVPPASREFGFAIGLYLAEGSALRNKLAISLDQDETELVDRFAAAVGLEYGKPQQREESRTRVYYFHNTAFTCWFRKSFGICEDKCMPPWLWHCGREMLAGVVEGLLLGDGHLHKYQNTTVFNSTRVSLAIAIRDAVASLGHGYGCITTREAGLHYGRNCQRQWTVTFTDHTNRSLRAEYGWPASEPTQETKGRHWYYSKDKQQLYVRIRKIERVDLDMVYDIEVNSPDHLYRLPGAITHNSELATWEGGGETLTQQIFPSMNATDTMAFMESTAEGRSGFWYRFWRDTFDGKTSWHPIFIPFYKVRKYSLPLGKDEVFVPTPDEEQLRTKVMEEDKFHISNEVLKWRRKKVAEFVSLEGDEFGFLQEYPCLSGRTRVPTERGLLPLRADLAGYRTDGNTITDHAWKGYKETFTATTARGYSITGTADHIVPTTDGDTAIDALLGKTVYLAPPEFSAEQQFVEWQGPCGAECRIAVTEDFARFLGYFLGDGCFLSGTVSIVCDAKDVDVVGDVSGLLKRFFDGWYVRVVGSKKGGIELRANNIEFKTVMQALGIWNPAGRPHRLVCVPEVIFRSPREVVRQFLRGLFESDGFNQYGSPRISLFSKHFEFLQDIQLLLLGFGITASLRSRPAKNGFGRSYQSNTLDLRAAEARKFCEAIGFVGNRKRLKLRQVDCPKGRPQAKIVMEDKVESFKPAGWMNVYDITVDHKHTFSANGILVHNCNWMEAFQGKGVCAFNKRMLYKMLSTTCEPPRYVGEINLDLETHHPRQQLRRVHPGDVLHNPKTEDRFWVWEEPNPDAMYYVAADVAQGSEGGDFSTVQVLKIGAGMEPDEQVAEWRGWMNPTPFAYVVCAIGYWYNSAEISVECNNVGKVTNNEIYRVVEYENVYRWKHIDKVKNALSNYIGWETNWKSREALIAKMGESIIERSIVLRSQWLVDEMLDFSYDEDGQGKAQGQSTKDDRVMAMMICRYCAHDSDYGKRAMARPMSSSSAGVGAWYILDPQNRKVAEFRDHAAAMQAFEQYQVKPNVNAFKNRPDTNRPQLSGYSIVQAAQPKDYANSLYSPIHQGFGLRSRMYYEMGYSAEEINHENVMWEQQAEQMPTRDDPQSWLNY